MSRRIWFVACVLVSMLAGVNIQAEEGSEDTADAYCQSAAKRVGINDEKSLRIFIDSCVQSLGICESEATDANLDSEQEFKEYVEQCIQEMQDSDQTDNEFNNDDENENQ